MRNSFATRRSPAQPDHLEDRSMMNPPEEFLRHAADCQRMAKFTRDPASRATWSRMAARCLGGAEYIRRQGAAPSRENGYRTDTPAPQIGCGRLPPGPSRRSREFESPG